MGAVNFDEFEAGLQAAASAFGERVCNLRDAFGRQRFGFQGFRRETLAGGGVDGAPAALCHGDRPALILPGRGRGRFEARVRQLSSGHAALLANESDDARQIFDMRVFPDAEVARTDASLGEHSDGFGEDGSCAAYSSRAEVNQMPVVGESILARVLAHGRNRNAVPEGNISNFE